MIAVATLAILVIAAGPPEPGPMDAYNANYAAIRVDTEFALESYLADHVMLPEWGRRFGKGMTFAAEPTFRANGRWDCDGTAEHYWIDVPGYSRPKPDPKTGLARLPLLIPCEVLFDSEILATRQFPASNVDVRRSEDVFLSLAGPLTFGTAEPLPKLLRHEMAGPGTVVEKFRSNRLGSPTEVEVRRKIYPPENGRPGAINQYEIWYDPAIGYLPRFVRAMVTDGSGRAKFDEVYILDTQACPAGGVVPTEWIELKFQISGFQRRYPNYDHETMIDPEGRHELRHLKVTRLSPRNRPAMLDHLEGARTVGARGGAVAIKAGVKTLSISDLKSMLGPRLNSTGAGGLTPIIPLAKQVQPARPMRLPGFTLAAASTAVIGLLAARGRTRRGLIGLALLAALPGCGVQPTASNAEISASFTRTKLIYDPSLQLLSMDLAVRNTGGVPLTLFNAGGGCSCRSIDASKFPMALKPGQEAVLPVNLSDRRQYDVQTVPFIFETDRGSIAAPASFLALPSHSINPSSLAINVIEGTDDEPIEIVHRAVFPSDRQPPETSINFPDAFRATPLRTERGDIDDPPLFSYRDVTYRLDLRASDLGLFKTDIKLRDKHGVLLIEIPVVGQRRPFLSTVPDRVTLGAAPVRVFLRCPDEAVELTKVISTPPGVRAVVSSTRELSVRLDDNAPGIIDGVTEVATTAEGRPPLKIATVRYSPAVN